MSRMRESGDKESHEWLIRAANLFIAGSSRAVFELQKKTIYCGHPFVSDLREKNLKPLVQLRVVSSVLGATLI